MFSDFTALNYQSARYNSDMTEETHYYSVALGLDGTWNEHRYIYKSATTLEVGRVLQVPFGKKFVNGIVLGKAEKPSFKVKPPAEVYEHILEVSSLELLDWLIQYYPGAPGLHVQQLLPRHTQNVKSPSKKSIKVMPTESQPLPPLKSFQRQAIQKLDGLDSSVLHGFTGSGKTRVYLELAQEQIKAGNDVIILTPEISLTPQLETTLKQHFSDETVHVYHSQMTLSQQRKSWLAASSSKGGNFFIGPRSALFLPYKRVGLVIVDEAHDSAYKQDSGNRYSGILVAAKLARIHSAQFIMGSATPPVQETHQLLQKDGVIVCMHELATDTFTEAARFSLVDMTATHNRSPSSSMFSKELLKQLKKSLDNGKQSLLFLNRRGTARLLMCTQCGWHDQCPECDMPLTYHHDNFQTRCHVCGYTQKAPSVCPQCSHELHLKTLGVKAIEQELTNLFPHARIARFDSDNKKSESFQSRYQEIAEGKADIILGTQLITKGLDLPKLETVGVLQADSALFLPDYTSDERAFQQLLQVSGRVGRGHTPGVVVMQTMQARHPLFKQITSQDWHEFYDNEIKSREESGFPPFNYLLKIQVAKKTPSAAESLLTKIRNQIIKTKNLKTLGPAPAFYEKSRNTYNWQLVVMSPSRAALVDVTNGLPKGTSFDLDPVSLL